MHLIDNAVHIKTLVAKKENPQGPEDFQQIKQIIHTAPIGRAGRKHCIVANAKAIMKEGFEQEKIIRDMKKEITTLKRWAKDVESLKIPTEQLKTFEPLAEGIDTLKREVIRDALVMVKEFMGALELVYEEEQKLKNIVVTKISLLNVLESAKPVMEEFQSGSGLSDEDVAFCNDYWFYLITLQQLVDRVQEVQRDITLFSDKVSIGIELMSFDVKFTEDSIPKDLEVIKIEVRNLLQGLIMTEDVNAFRTGSHLRHAMKAYAWRLEMKGSVVEVDSVAARNRARIIGILRGL